MAPHYPMMWPHSEVGVVINRTKLLNIFDMLELDLSKRTVRSLLRRSYVLFYDLLMINYYVGYLDNFSLC